MATFQDQDTLYDQVVRVTHVYLGPAADRFISRQVQNHLHKPPQQLTAEDLSRLIDWIQVAVSFLTEDSELVEEYTAQLHKLSGKVNHASSKPGQQPAATGARARTPIGVAEVQAESEAMFRSIGDGAIATDEFGHITRINPTALKILGLTAEESIGQWFPRIIPIARADGSPLPLIERPIVHMFLSGQAVSEKVFYRTKGGDIVPVSVTVSPIILNSRPVGAIEVFRDITLENEIDRMKSEFISLASHQLRTPLSTIKTYAHMLADGYIGKLTTSQTRTIQTIIGATNTMNELIGTLLNIAKIESGSIEITAKPLDMAQLTGDVLKQLQVTADMKQVRLRLAAPRHSVRLATDSLILKEILTNLVGNAIKYTPSGGRVELRLRSLPREVVFSVADTGIGIPEAAQDKIFSKFFRAPNVLRQETSGTGLGLYVVKGLVGTLQGRVWFESVEHEGSTFYVALPKRPAGS